MRQSNRHRPNLRKPPKTAVIDLTISHIGARGDGVGEYLGRPVFVPLSAPGDRLTVRLTEDTPEGWRGELHEAIELSPHRAEPVCPHFGPCGGCALQHVGDEWYAAWKLDLLRQSLVREKLDPEIAPLVRVPPASRRRLILEARVRSAGRVALGFHERRGEFVVDVTACAIAHPGLLALLPSLREALARLRAGTGARLTLTMTDAGVDMLIEAGHAPDLSDREAWARFARDQDLARLSWLAPRQPRAEPIVARRPAAIALGDASVVPPPGGFLQASARAEAAMRVAVVEALAEAHGPIADLYSGCGTFALPLARDREVTAVDAATDALDALRDAAREQRRRVFVEARDLASDPPGPAWLGRFAGVVFDPPRAGAKSLCRELARSKVPLIAAVSCNPATFARDAAILAEGGYRLTMVTPIDQFLWSPHLELVGAFRRM